MLPVDLSFLDAPTHPEMFGRIGRYDVEALLGRGGMGVVLRAHDSDLHRSVAVKVMAPEWAASMPARQRFAREAQAAASVAHENVIPIYNVEADAKLPYLVMLYVPGMTLERWVMTNGPADPATILRIAGQLAEGLAAAHRRGLVHRDIKPGNVLVGENSNRVWITDFGLARAADSMTLTQTGIIAGTPHYMSPEQARGEALDHRTDLFSLGCVLYFLSTGKPPFDADNTLAVLHKIVSEKPTSLAVHRADLPHSFVSLVDQLLSRAMNKRPMDCESVIATLAVAQEELRDGRVGRPPISFKRAGLAIAGISLIAAVTLFAFAAMKRPRDVYANRVATDVQQVDGNAGDAITVQSFDPYITRAAVEVIRAGQLADDRWQRELDEVSRRVGRLSHPDQTVGRPAVHVLRTTSGNKNSVTFNH